MHQRQSSYCSHRYNNALVTTRRDLAVRVRTDAADVAVNVLMQNLHLGKSGDERKRRKEQMHSTVLCSYHATVSTLA